MCDWDGKSDEEVYQNLVSAPWKIFLIESNYDNLSEEEQKVFLTLADSACVPERVRGHQGWLRRASLLWFKDQFYNGGYG